MGVGVVGVAIAVAVGTLLTRHVLSSGGLSSTRQSRVRGVVTTVGGINGTVAAGRLSGRDLGLGLSSGDTTETSTAGTGIGILGLAVAAVVVVGEALLVNSIEGRVFAASGGSRLSWGLVGEGLLDLRLGLADLLGEGVEGLLGLGGVASEVVEGLGGGLGNGRKTGGRASLAGTLGRGRKGRTRSNGGVLRRLSAGLGLLTVLIDVHSVTVQAHATKLHGSTVHSVVAGHDNSLLLLHHTTLEAGSTAALLQSAAREGAGRRTGRSGSRHSGGVKGATDSAGSSCSGRRSGNIGNLFEIGLGQVILGSLDGGLGNDGNGHFGGLGDGCLLCGGGDGNGDRSGSGFGGLSLLNDGLFGLFGGRSRSGLGSLLGLGWRRRGFGEEAGPSLLCALGDHTGLGLSRL
jgi:hypothetical protein